MKVQAIKLIGATLDWAIAKAAEPPEGYYPAFVLNDGELKYAPSTNWSQGGPIIERENIAVCHYDYHYNKDGYWVAEDARSFGRGPTPLIAAMRCYVTSKLGAEVEIPDDLISAGVPA